MVCKVIINARRTFPRQNSGIQLCPFHTGLQSEADSPSPESVRNSSRNRSASSAMPCWTAYSKSASVRISASMYLSRCVPVANISSCRTFLKQDFPLGFQIRFHRLCIESIFLIHGSDFQVAKTRKSRPGNNVNMQHKAH